MGVNVSLHIEELVLHGFAPGDRHAIAAGLQDELMRTLTEQGLPPALAQSANLTQINGGAISIKPDSSPRTWGRQVAKSILGNMQR